MLNLSNHMFAAMHKHVSLIQIKVSYSYYSSKRTTPVCLVEDELEKYTFDEFRQRIIKDVPHLAKAVSLRWTVDDDSLEVDLSPIYFNFQIKTLLVKGKAININVIEFDSPAASTSSSGKDTVISNSNVVSRQSTCNKSKQTRTRRSLVLDQAKNPVIIYHSR